MLPPLWFSKGWSTVRSTCSLDGSSVAPPSLLVNREMVVFRLALLVALGAV